jgi:ribose/xylose/arabinose/galactoside ABC-type transport system permease subunit
MTMVMIDGEIDLSVGAVLALGLGAGDRACNRITSASGPRCSPGLMSGAALGFAERDAGRPVSGMHSFIVTLGGLIGIRGLVFVYTGENALMVRGFQPIPRSPRSISARCRLTAMIFLGLAALLPVGAVEYPPRARGLCGGRQYRGRA